MLPKLTPKPIPLLTLAKKSISMRSYDEIFKELFKYKVILQDFLINFIGEKWVYEIDFDSIEPYPTEFISRSFKKRFCDLIYRVKIKMKISYGKHYFTHQQSHYL